MIRFDILTLFPDVLEAVLGSSIIGRARKNGFIEVNIVNIRDFSRDKHRRVDDYPYGGGTGMVIQPQPVYDAYLSLVRGLEKPPRVIYMTPQGRIFNEEIAVELSRESHLILLCGHYEGIDERVLEEIVTDEISIGDYVLTGGEIPACVVVDAVSRLIPGVLAEEASYADESIYSGLLEYPQYTRPPEFMGRCVPEVLLSGHHANIQEWRKKQSLLRTLLKRPDLLEKRQMTDEEARLLEQIRKELASRDSDVSR